MAENLLTGKFLEALEIIGICTMVIVVLMALLILFLYGFGFLVRKRKTETQFITPEKKIDARIVAAITACINYFYETEKPECGVDFIVKSIKKNKKFF